MSYFSSRATSGGDEDLSGGYEGGEILAGDSDADVNSPNENEGEPEIESSKVDASFGDESSSEPEMNYFHRESLQAKK